MKKKSTALLGMLVVASCSFGELLMEVDFAGTPGPVGTIAATDSQITLNSAATFTVPGTAVKAIGGGAGTAGWVYDGTGTAAANTDLHVASTFGSPTRIDIDMGLAAAGFGYTITNVEIVVRASNSAGTQWDFGYRDTGGTPQVLPGGAITVQSGADPLTTYSIDLSSEGLTASDSAVAWNTTGTGKLRVMFFESTGTGNDNLQIDAIRLNGTVIPEPATLGLISLASAGLFIVRRYMI